MGPHDDLRERNREILAARLGWPDGAIEEVRELEESHPGYSVYWGTGRLTSPRPGYYASLPDERAGIFYGATAGELDAKLTADAARRDAEVARWRNRTYFTME